jgi:hypothetical protein
VTRVPFNPSRALRRLTGAVAAALTLAAGAASAAEAPPHVIKAPHYGDSLFYFFQDRYFTSVTNLMVSQHFTRLPQHEDEAQVLRGGLFLSYGLHREAGQIFAQLIEKGAPPPVRDRAWFYLAKIRYQRGYLAEAEDAIGRVEKPLPGDLEEDRVLLRAQLLMARQDYAGAAQVLATVKPGKGLTGQYARYNLGVALIKSGETARGIALLDEIGRTPATNEEMKSLRDKANVALGYAALQENTPREARTYLERVRLAGLQANKALLGFGWAAAAMNQPKVALVPWMELAQRDTGDSAVLEAKLAVPYALAELGAYGQSLKLYEDAVTVFERESADLDESVAAIRAGKLVEDLLALNPGDEMGWFWNIQQLPQMPHAGHLAQILAQHEFQEAFKNYRDLRFLERNLREWQDKLGVFGDMLANRRQAYEERVPRVAEKERALGIAELQRRGGELAAELARVERDSDVHALADAKERDLVERLARVREIVERDGNDPDVAAARDRYRRVAGALSWRLTMQFHPRLWEAKKNMKALEGELAQARALDAALAQAQRDEPARFDKLAARIALLSRQVKAQIPRVEQLAAEQQKHVQELAAAELLQQKERVAEYATQARFAVAQIYDRAYVAKDMAKDARNAARE